MGSSRTSSILVGTLGACLPLAACSFTGDSLKAPAGQSATTVTASPSSTSPSPSSTSTVADSARVADTVTTPSGKATAGAFAFCDHKNVKNKACSSSVSVYEGGDLACSTTVKPGRKVRMRVLKDGQELTSATGDVGKPGRDGKVALSGDIGVDPAALPAGIYTCEFTVDGGKPLSGSVKVKGPQGVSGVSQVRLCPQVSDATKGSASTLSCATSTHDVQARVRSSVQCSAVVAGAKGTDLRLRIRKGNRDFDFPFKAAQVNKNLGVVTGSITIAGSDDVRCEIYRSEKLAVQRDFSLHVTT